MSHVILAGALAASCAGIGGFIYGTRIGAAQEQAAQARAEKAAETEREKQQDRIDDSAQRQQAAEYARQFNVREIYRETQKIIDRPVYRNVCVDADGVGLLDRAAAAANGEGVGTLADPAAQAATGTTR